ncbi:2-methylcitrate dehydratase PrpD [Ruegeria halocynthiae]|uniref:2-methylcitrate dehydratase PrpD n=1 Tax=Ruegeria halocynthiae TaxID=985054 RepID=A0A1H3AHN1_9RHOB|nr:MmgE/PrpD family protein [Ruegeria halocynthiae]SDX29105.1 2-methylcitrate dehydratase PrpD [Ruegeria halocynthiae]
MTNALNQVMEFTLNSAVEDVPASARDNAALLLLDTIGVLIAAGPMQAGGIARDTAALLYASAEPEYSARMLFDGRRVSLAGAAYATATQTDNLDAHDGFNPVKGHIGVAVVPALAALAEQCPDLTGPEALTTMIVGYEVAGRAGLALHATVNDYHTSGAWNALGVAAMAARLRGQSPGQLRQALGIAEFHGPRSQMMREIENPTMLHDGSGWGALVGLSAAVLAERGFTGAPAITIEAMQVAPYWADLGSVWQIEQQYIKPYPICRWAHAAIDGVRLLMDRHGLSHQQIASIRINSFHEAACLFANHPQTTSQAQYSLPFAVAVQAVNGRIGVEHISGAGLSNPEVAQVMSRIEVTERQRHSARFPEGRWADVAIEISDGTVYESGDLNARGGPELPLSQQEIIDKFTEFAAPVVGGNRADKICTAILKLTLPGARYSDLSDLLYDPPAG